MTRMLRKIFKWMLILLALAAITVGSWFFVRWRQWPDWSIAAIVAGFGLAIVAIVVIRYFLNRSRERAFVQNIVREDEKHAASLGGRDENLGELREQWLRAISVLQRSNMRLRGNPLYALPWYMVFGESESGKSSMIANSRLASIASEVGPVRGISATRHCDWWFFNDSVMIDTAGRYAIPIERNRDLEEWETFLTLLSKYRRRESLNGLIITIASERLIAGDSRDIFEYGSALRKRIDHLMRVLATRLPVYIMVTKIDKLYGVGELIAHMAENDAKQCAGALNPVEQGRDFHPADVARKTVRTVAERLSTLHLILLRDRKIAPASFQSPGEISALEEGLATFVNSVFHRNPYIETPLFRGLFFSSALQYGPRHSLLLKDIEAFQSEEKPRKEGNRGVFLHDLFARILPEDRYVGRKILKYVTWRQMGRHVGYGAWVAGIVLVCVMMSMSYRTGRKVLNAAAMVQSGEPRLEERRAVLLHLLGLYEEISTLEEMNEERIIPFLGLNQPVEAVNALKRVYSRQFQTFLLDRDIKRYQAMVEGAGVGFDLKTFKKGLRDLLWLTADMKNAMGAGYFTHGTGDKADISFDLVGDWREKEIYPILLQAWLRWNDHPLQAKTAYRSLQALSLQAMEKATRSGVSWLVDWVNADYPSYTIDLKRYWAGSGKAPAGLVIPPAYTVKGYGEIKALLQKAHDIAGKDKDINGRIEGFWSWYAREWTGAWVRFIHRFDEGWQLLKGQAEISATLAAITAGEGPYLRFFATMDRQFSVLAELPDSSPGDSLARRLGFLDKIMDTASRLKEGEDPEQAGVIKRITTGLREGQVTDTEKLLAGAGLWKHYTANLRELSENLHDPDSALFLASLYYGREAGVASAGERQNTTLYGKARTSLRQLRSRLDWPDDADTQTLFQLLGGALRFFEYDATATAAARLQSIWTQDVLAPVSGSHHKSMAALFKPGTPIQTFIATLARPFVIPGVKAWKASSWNGRVFPFTQEFLTFLHAGQESLKLPDAKRFDVTIATRPIEVNGNAAVRPQSVSLQLECSGEVQTLTNFNYTSRLNFHWDPQTCGRTRLTISFPAFELLRDYPEKNGFLNFLGDFRDGSRTFRAADFRERKAMLKAIGVSSITIAYTIRGGEEPVLLLRRKDLEVPQFIVRSDAMLKVTSR
ncbi:MAG: type VI secretion protein IcmF/TssM N-terminal domain-containing protein [Hyphomicrobiales bacterium]